MKAELSDLLFSLIFREKKIYYSCRAACAEKRGRK